MAGINLRGETSGSVEITSPAVAGDNTITLPNDNGSANQFFKNSTTAGIVTHSSMVELANGRIGIGTASPDNNLHVLTSDTDVVKFESSSAGAGPAITLDHTTTSPADDDNIGKIVFEGRNDANQSTTYADIKAITTDVSDSSEDCALTFNTRGAGSFAERLRVTSGGDVGINTNNPAHMLVLHTVSTTGYSTLTADTPNPNTLLHLENQNGTDNAGVDNYVAAEFSVGRGATSQGWLGYTRTGNNQGAFFIKQRNASSSYPETIRFPSSGGVTFGGGANSANTLDDYEEGTYTPTFTCTSGSITLNGSYNIISYEKIGNSCHVHGRVRVSSVSSPSGTLVIGLPFTRSNPGEDSARIGGSCVVQNGSGNVADYVIHPTGATGVELARGDTSSIDVTVADNFSGDELVYISVTYRTV